MLVFLNIKSLLFNLLYCLETFLYVIFKIIIKIFLDNQYFDFKILVKYRYTSTCTHVTSYILEDWSHIFSILEAFQVMDISSSIIMHKKTSIHIVSSISKYNSPFFRNKKFVLNEMFQQNTSKFATFYAYENPHGNFSYLISCNLTFFSNEEIGKFWSITMEHFFEQKHLISEEWLNCLFT